MPALTGREAIESYGNWINERERQGKSHGLSYEDTVNKWWDQYFEMEVNPAGTHTCATPLRFGQTHYRLDIVLIASSQNNTPIHINKGTQITVSLEQADQPDGQFEELGPSVCITAGDDMDINRECPIFRFHLGDSVKAWVKPKIEFGAGITGGTVDVALGYIPGY